MRLTLWFLFLGSFLGSACSSSTSQSEDTVPEPDVSDNAGEEPESTTTGDTRERSLEAAAAFGESLGPILATVPDDRAFEACEQANELMNRANAMREVGVPDGVSDAGAFEEELARLHSAASMMATYCGRGVDTVPPNFWVSTELTFYRLMLQLEPNMEGAASETAHIEAALALREALETMIAAHPEDRIGELCQRIEQIVTSVERLEGLGTPSSLPSGRHYTEEMTRLVTEVRTTAGQCEQGVESVSNQASISIEVTAMRLWFMLHRRWPGAR